MKTNNLKLEDILDHTRKIITNFFLEQKISKDKLSFNFLIPKKLENGDISCNLFLKSPILLANNSPQRLLKILFETNFFSNIVVDKGHLNFFYSDDLTEIIFKNLFLPNLKFKNKKILVEYISANPTGKLHLGHGRNGVFGNIIYQTYLFLGFDVKNNFYVNDSGKQINIFLDSLRKKVNNFPEKVTYEGEYLEALKNDYLKKNWESFSEEKLKKLIVDNVLKKFSKLLKKININFDNFTYESEVLMAYQKTILEYLWKNQLIYEKDGATWLKFFDNFGYEDKVLIKQNNENTYLMGDICCQYKRFLQGYEKVIIILGADHDDYVKRLKYFLSLLKINNENWKLISLQIINVFFHNKIEKMSKRIGTSIDLEKFINEVGSEKIKFFLISYTKNSPLTLDLEKIKKIEKNNSYYYCQYVFARINGLLAKFSLNKEKDRFFTHLNEEEKQLFRFSLTFRIQLLLLIDQNEPHNIYKFLLELVKKFHKYYENEKIISENKFNTEIKLSLVLFIKKVLENIFKIISITPIEKM